MRNAVKFVCYGTVKVTVIVTCYGTVTGYCLCNILDVKYYSIHGTYRTVVTDLYTNCNSYTTMKCILV